MNIYLVRHTEYENPQGIFAFHLPVYLSKKGRKDAVKIGKWFVKNKLENLPIYTSPIVRCVQSSELIASQTGSFVKVDSRLIEVPCDNLEGKKKPKQESWVLEQDDPSREPKDKVIKRMMSIFTERVKDNKDCILVSHGEPLTFLYFHLTNTVIPKYPWSPENKNIIIRKGELVKMEIRNGSLVRAKKLSPLD